MGEGWSLNLPSISCQVEDYEKYSRRQAELSSTAFKKMFYLKNEISVEKANFFMNVNYSIPGVGSGKLVYIYSKGEDHFFSPNVFENPIIAVLNSGRWEITAPNGDRYEFVGTPSLRQNGNLRTHKYRANPRPNNSESYHYNNYSSYQGSNIKPREVVAEWFCTRISNPFASGDAIFFEGEPYGKALDHYGLWRQDAIKELPFTSAYSGIPQYHQGYLLRKLRSGTEELKLNYERVVPDLPLSGGGGIEDVDIMYARQAIYDSENEDESDWKRFKHVGASTLSNRSEGSFYNGANNTNPYLEQVTGNVVMYNVDYPEDGSGDDFKIAFKHGYLESPALPVIANGEFLELEFSVDNKSRPLLLDVNVLAGDDISFSSGTVEAEVYAGHRGIGIQNTFQSPLKYYSRNTPAVSTFKYGINSPALGIDNKVFIQIGPANSDTRFGEDLASPTLSGYTYNGAPNEPITLLSYFNSLGSSELITDSWIGQNDGSSPDEGHNFDLPIYPTASMPSNFGIGLPWHNMLNFYNEEIGIPFHTQNPRLFGKQTAGYFNFLQPFWWKSSKMKWSNIPTAADENVFLTNVKVYRYFKKKIALTSVKKYVKGVLGSGENPTAENLGQQTKNEISNIRLQYSVEGDAYRVSLPHGGGEATNSTLYTLLLRTIVNVPLEQSLPVHFDNSELEYPTTYFTYSKLLNGNGGVLRSNWESEAIGGTANGQGASNFLMANLPNSYIMDGYIGPLGNRKIIKYKSTGEGGSYGFMTRSSPVMRGNSAGNFQTGAANGGQFQDNFAAKFIVLVDRVEYWDRDKKLAFKYDYIGDRQFSSLRTSPHDNLNEDAVWNTETPGFASMKKTGPFLASSNPISNVPFTEYEHYVDPILRGKLKTVTTYDKDGGLVSSTQNEYSYSLAFEPGVTRMLPNRSYSDDYIEYHSARPSVPLNRFSRLEFAQYLFLITGQNDEPAGHSIRPIFPRVGGMELYSPWTPSRNNNSGLTTEDTYGTNNNMISESSFFVQLDRSISTDYMYCSEDEVFGVTTTTEYDYYSAEYDGTFDAGVFGAIGPDIGENGRLWVVPSFLPAIKRTTNSHSQISTTEQYFYHWDLKNIPGYLGGNGIDQQTYGLLFKLAGTIQGARPVRNLTYETRTTTGDVTKSTFNVYTSDVNFEYQEYEHYESELTIVCPSGEGVDAGGGPLDCEDNSGGNADCPNDNGCYLTGSVNSDTPIGYCRQAANPRMVCPCSLEGGVGAPEVEEIPFGNDEDPLNFQGNGAAFSFKNFGFIDALGDGPQPSSIPSPEDQNIPILKAVYVQVQAGGGTGANVGFSNGLENPEFHVPVVKTYELTSRTPYNLPVETRDVKGLKTHYDYAPIKVLHHEQCVRNQYVFRTQTAFSAAAGLPVAITVGEGNNALVTTYEYDKRRTLTSMTDPNNIVSTYSYDDFRRLEFSFRNGEPLSQNIYSNFKFTPQTYNVENYQYNLGEVLNNRVSSTAYIGNGGGNTTTQYLDHLGRQSGQEVAYTGGTGSAGGHITGAPAYDIFGRTIAVKNVGASDPFLPSGAGTNPDFTNNYYAPAPRGQVLKSARAGLSLDGNAYKTIETCIASDSDLREVITSTGNTLALDFLPGGTTIKKRVIDEDGKIYESYSDGAGLGIATVSYEEGVPYAATVNQYDGRGNLVNSINPKEQITSYQYNYLGQPFEFISPDAGTTKVAYNVEGGVLSTVNGNGKQTSFKFDDFGRQIEQIDGVSPGVFSNEGLPWVNSLTDPWSYIITFGSGTKPKLEKVWQYNKLTQPSDFTDDLPGNFSSSNTLGRIAATFSYDDEYKPVHGTTFKYNEDGFVYEEASVFSNSKEEYVDYTVNYGDFLLNGSAETVSVDVSNDGVDFTHHFAYDGLGRLTRVSLSVPDQEIANQKYAEYSYNSDNTQLSATTYFSPGGEVMGIANKYDVANRLTSMSSPLYTENIIYDKGNEGYFNGNIFSVESIYGIAPYLSSPSTMGESSTYKYTYDGLNRLTKASLELGGNIFQHIENVAGNLDDFGTVEYGYDKVGNLESILRGEFDEELGQIGKIASAMSFPDQNNQLESVTQSGLGISSPSTFMYGHDGAGSLVSDGRTGKSVSYTRVTYPLTSGGDKFIYDINDARIHKKGEKNEFYLRNGAGQELAIIDLDELTATWYAFGLTRFAEIGTSVGDCGEVPCRPEPPIVNGGVNSYDAIALSNAQGTNINQISYPVTLFRLQLPSDQDVYLLGSELSGLGGQYNILQQVLINGEGDLLVVENITTEVTEEISFGDFLTDRLSQFNDLLVNGFHVCQEECQEDVFACSDETLEQQKQDIKLLRSNRFTNDGTTLFTIVRIRLCNGDELYADQAQLENISGAFLILQKINVDPANFTGISFEIGSSSGTITSPNKLGEFLYNSSVELSLDGYIPCFTIEPCAEETPVCINDQGPDYSAIRNVIDANNVVSYPAKLRRVRLCDGKELHLLADELKLLNGLSYKLLQEVVFLTSNQKITVIDDGGLSSNLTLEELLPLRNAGRISRVDDYPDCKPEGCEVPSCSDSNALLQAAVLNSILADPIARNSGLTYPATLTLIISCSGNEYWLTSDEMELVRRVTNTGNSIRVENSDTEISVQTIDGAFQNVDLADFFQLDHREGFISVNGLLGCENRNQADCINDTVSSSDCQSGDVGRQIAAIQNLPAFSNACGFVADRLRLVELCGGESYYLADNEIALIPGLVTVSGEVGFTGASNPYQVVYNGNQQSMSVAQIMCNRFTGLELIAPSTCTIVEYSEAVSCSVKVLASNLRTEVNRNSFEINLLSDIITSQECTDGFSDSDNSVFSKSYSYRTRFEETICVHGGNDLFQIETITLKEVLSGTELKVRMSPDALEQDYPGIMAHFNSSGRDLNNLIITSGQHRSFLLP